jgi:predicted ATP-binding protein involved in virulence
LVYNILKVSDMLNSQHLSTMSTEAKRCSLLMALEAAGAEIEDLLQDAVVRQRALNDFEDSQQNKLKDLESAKAAENRQIQGELDRLTGQYMALIQANVDEVAREQDNFRAWQRRKQEEAQRISDAATFCVPPGTADHGGLSAVLERATASRK